MPTIIKPFIEPEILSQIQSEISTEQQVIVHCCLKSDFAVGILIRIWRTTYLLDTQSSHKSRLLFADNICLNPDWIEVPFVKEYWFTLIFSGLPKDCTHFDFAEIIPEEGGFYVPNIQRNGTDVYSINI
ncbi:hypothetical protein [Frigoriflavimonas asaccharolytica]|uniref:Uncharacterized protein n=1 Tax=Frigoriflavimonas asaccharolytica TaxID=2735899 RepID=A0A8J8KBA2_9FLAO|nr:hypothetical protein [Frigoriflavimonas asaccharolytica]NRS92359.1 hypothetical protein [Frigoriflavimonas asaccharolytica]